jgi:hypothetical protein
VCMNSKRRLITLRTADASAEAAVNTQSQQPRTLSKMYSETRNLVRGLSQRTLGNSPTLQQRGRADVHPLDGKLVVLSNVRSGYPQFATRLELSSKGKKLAVLGAAITAEGSGKPLCRIFDTTADVFGWYNGPSKIRERPKRAPCVRTNLEHLVHTASVGSWNTSAIQGYLAYVSGQRDEAERHRMSR